MKVFVAGDVVIDHHCYEKTENGKKSTDVYETAGGAALIADILKHVSVKELQIKESEKSKILKKKLKHLKFSLHPRSKIPKPSSLRCTLIVFGILLN